MPAPEKKYNLGLPLLEAQESYMDKVDGLSESDPAFKAILEQLKQLGKNFVRQTGRTESKKFDEKFVDELEKGFDCIDRIIAHPRTFIKDEAEVVEAGLARKITSQSIVHLASHTNFVHSVDEKGNVTPERILTVRAEADYQIYENRFVMTLIKKCSVFIEKRFQFIKDHGDTRNSEVLIMKSVNEFEGARYEVESHIKVSSPSEDEGLADKNASILARLKVLRDRCGFYVRCPFMENLKGAKDVSNPVHMTNMLAKNPDYHGAYVLWQFIDNYLDLGLEYGIKETEQEFDDAYSNEIYSLIAAQILTLRTHLVGKNRMADLKQKEKVIKPRVLFTLEDEVFYNGKFLYDQFPEAHGDEIFHVPGVDDKVRNLMQQELEKKTADAFKKSLLEEEIEKQKAKDIAEEALERQRKAEEEAAKTRLEEEFHIKEEEARIALENARRIEEDRLAKEEEQRKLEELRQRIKRSAIESRAEDMGFNPSEIIFDTNGEKEDEYIPFEVATDVKQIFEEEDGKYIIFSDSKGVSHKFKLNETKEEPEQEEKGPDSESATQTSESEQALPPEDGNYVTFYDKKGILHRFKVADKKEEAEEAPLEAKKPGQKEIIETEEGRFVTFYDKNGVFHKFRLKDKKEEPKAEEKKASKPKAPKKNAPFKKEIIETEEGRFATFYDKDGNFHKFRLKDGKKTPKKAPAKKKKAAPKKKEAEKAIAKPAKKAKEDNYVSFYDKEGNLKKFKLSKKKGK